MKRRKSRGITEISIKLLPEKDKRDYLLRLVSSIIILCFVILNFFLVYIPLNQYRSELNELKRQNAEKYHEVLALQHKYNFFFEDIYNNNEGTVKDILNHNINITKILKLFDIDGTYVKVHDNLSVSDLIKPENNENLLPSESKVESISFNESNMSFVVSIQFKDFKNLTDYHETLKRIKYIEKVSVGSYVPVQVEGNNYVKTTFTITINPTHENCPKVGA